MALALRQRPEVRPAGRTELPVAGRPEFCASTLVELLIVVAIVSLLISLAVPSLLRARVLARRAVCGVPLSNRGKAAHLYLSTHHSYPYFGNSGIKTYDGAGHEYAGYWPNICGLLQIQEFPGTPRTNYGTWAFLHESVRSNGVRPELLIDAPTKSHSLWDGEGRLLAFVCYRWAMSAHGRLGRPERKGAYWE